MCITPRSQVIKISQKATPCTIHPTAKSSSAVCIAPQSQGPQCASHCVVKLHTAESKLKSLWFSGCFKGTFRRNPFRGIHFYHERKDLKKFFWFAECVTRFSTSTFFHDSNPSGPLINRLKYFRIWFRKDIWSQSSKNLTPRCAWHREVKTLGIANQIVVFQIFSFMINVFTLYWLINLVILCSCNERLSLSFHLDC